MLCPPAGQACWDSPKALCPFLPLLGGSRDTSGQRPFMKAHPPPGPRWLIRDLPPLVPLFFPGKAWFKPDQVTGPHLPCTKLPRYSVHSNTQVLFCPTSSRMGKLKGREAKQSAQTPPLVIRASFWTSVSTQTHFPRTLHHLSENSSAHHQSRRK